MTKRGAVSQHNTTVRYPQGWTSAEVWIIGPYLPLNLKCEQSQQGMGFCFLEGTKGNCHIPPLKRYVGFFFSSKDFWVFIFPKWPNISETWRYEKKRKQK